ncbi:MAG: hypothetical protein KVP17_004520 [Porospora cf. gigantea B]|nr:MAG: hypothetical protein KVP17_004520 [Porospora cf. gigantea B]
MLTEDSNWLYKNKDHGMMAASASTGAILMWQLESGLSRIDKYQWASESYVKAGAYMAFGLVSAGIRSQCDPAFALLMEPLEFTNELEVLGAVLGIGFALAGSKREDVTEYLLPLAADPQGCPGGLEVAAMAAVSLGLIFVGVGPCDASEALLQTLMELDMSSQDLLAQPLALYYGMALALIYQGTQSRSQAAYDVICSIRTRPFGAVCRVLMTASAYAASGDLLKIQHCLHVVTDGVESVDEEENQVEPVVEEDKPSEEASSFPDVDRAYAVIALALITMGDDVGSEMLMQLVNSLLQFGDRNVKQAISLALAVKSISHPQPLVVDLLTKMSHDTDGDVALHAIISLGLVGAGSNNSKIAQTLRQLASYYSKDVHATFITNISLGLVYLGKGLLTLSPSHSDGFLMRQTTLAHIQLLVFSCLLMNDTILRNKTHYLLWHAVAGARPKMADTLDAETLAPREVLVRVGQQVNTVGLAGKPRGVTAFQTHNTPILVNSGQRAELDASTTYVPLTPVIEGTVLVVDEPDDCV